MPHQCTNCARVFDDGSKEMLSGCPDCGGTKFQFRPGEDAFSSGDAASGDVAPGGREADADPSPERPAAQPPSSGSAPAQPPSSGSAPAQDPSPGESSTPEPSRPDRSVAETVGNAAATVRNLVGGTSTSDRQPEQEPSTPPQPGTGTEDTAQADARSQIVEPDEIPDSSGFTPSSTPERDSQQTATDRQPDQAAADRQTPAGRQDAASRQGTAAAEDATQTAESAGAVDDREVVDQPDAERGDRPDIAELREELNDQFESIRVVERGQYELNLMELYDRDEYIIALQEDGRYSIQVPDTWGESA